MESTHLAVGAHHDVAVKMDAARSHASVQGGDATPNFQSTSKNGTNVRFAVGEVSYRGTPLPRVDG